MARTDVQAHQGDQITLYRPDTEGMIGEFPGCRDIHGGEFYNASDELLMEIDLLDRLDAIRAYAFYLGLAIHDNKNSIETHIQRGRGLLSKLGFCDSGIDDARLVNERAAHIEKFLTQIEKNIRDALAFLGSVEGRETTEQEKHGHNRDFQRSTAKEANRNLDTACTLVKRMAKRKAPGGFLHFSRMGDVSKSISSNDEDCEELTRSLATCLHSLASLLKHYGTVEEKQKIETYNKKWRQKNPKTRRDRFD